MEDSTSKAMHDLLLALADEPAKQAHLAERCRLCATETEEENVTAQTLTQDEHQAAVDAAVAAAVAAAITDKDARIAELEATHEKSETDAAIAAAVAEAVAEKDSKIAELESSLDAESIARKTAEDAATALVAWLEGEADTQTAETRKVERLQAVKDLQAFPEDALAARADRWADMTDEEFADQLEEYKVLAAGKAPVGNGPLPKNRSVLSDTAEPPARKGSATRTVLESFIGSTAAN